MEMDELEDVAEHFLPWKLTWTWDGRTWSILHHVQEVRSRAHYIFGMDRHMFQNVAVRDPRHNTDHYMVLGCLRRVTLRENKFYLGSKMQLPLYPPK